MNHKLKIFLAWLIVLGTLLGCQQRGKVTKKSKKNKIIESLGPLESPDKNQGGIDTPESVSIVLTEDSSSAEVAFTAPTLTSAPAATCSAPYLSYSSSNQTLIPLVSSVVWGGTWPNCTAIFSPVANGAGNSTIEILASDGTQNVPIRAFTLEIAPVNDSPSITPFSGAPQVTSEDLPLSFPFTVDDPDGALSCSATNLVYTSDNPALVPATGAVVWSGTWPNCVGTVTPAPNGGGLANITFLVSDGQVSSSTSFPVSVTLVNDAPLMADIPSQTTDEDAAKNGISFTISDVDSSLDCNSSLTAVSSQIAVLPNGNITLSGTAPNCTISLNPTANSNGSTTVTVTVTDGSLTGQDTFILTVSAVNDGPSISNVSDQSTPSGTALTGIGVTIGDIDSTLTCSSLSGTSSNNSLISSSEIAFSGTSPNCSLSLSPLSGQSGSATISLSVSDGTLNATDTLLLTVAPPPQSPVISDVSNQETPKDTVLSNVPFTISDGDSTLSCASSVTGSSSNTSLVPALGFSFSGTAPNCLVSITPAASLGGLTTITLTVSDGVLTNSDSFILRVPQWWYQESYIKASNSNEDDYFSEEGVSLSENTILVGSTGEDANQITISDGILSSTDNSLDSAGAAYIYTRSGSNWSQQAYLKGSNASATAYFGTSVSLSGDTAAVGTGGEDSNQSTITNGPGSSPDQSSPDSGAVYIYKRSASIWAQEAYIKASNSNTQDEFGEEISLSGDSLVVGARFEDSPQETISNGATASTINTKTDSGAVYVYARIGTSWTQQAYIKASYGDPSDYFGSAVALSGETLTVGAGREDSSQTTVTNGTMASLDNTLQNSGAIYIFRRMGNIWKQEAFIKAPNPLAGPDLGYATSLSGSTVAVGAESEYSNQSTITNGTTASDDDSQWDVGAVYLFKRTGSTWAQEAYIKASNSRRESFFGSSVSISGNQLLVGSYWENASGTTIVNNSTVTISTGRSESGAAYMFSRVGNTWTQEAYFKASNSSNYTYFASSVGLSGDTAVVGRYGDESNQTTITNGSTSSADVSTWGAGAVFVYRNLDKLFDPSDVVATSSSPSSFVVSWSPQNVGMGNGDFKVVYGTSEPSPQCTSGTVAFSGAGSSSAVSTGLSQGQTYWIRVCSFDGINYSEGVLTQVTTISTDVTPPTVLSINRGSTANPLVGGATVFDFEVTFSESIYNISRDHFTLMDNVTNLPAIGSVTQLDCAANICAVWAVSGSAGDFRLDLTSNSGISDFWGNFMNTVRQGDEFYTLPSVGWSQESYIKPLNANINMDFGRSLSLHGDTLIVGASYESSNQSTITNGTTSSTDTSLAYAGSSYIYKRSGTIWAQEAYLKASNLNSDDRYGGSVSLSGDTVVVGASGEDSNQRAITNGTGASTTNTRSASGAVFVYKRAGSVWAQEAYIKSSNADVDDRFGHNVSLSGDTLVVGAAYEDSNLSVVTNGTTASTNNTFTYSGAVYVFARTGSTWAQQAYIKASNNVAAYWRYFGDSTSIYGNRIAIGSRAEQSNQTTITNGTTSSTDTSLYFGGAVYVYKRSNSSWAQETYIKPSNIGREHSFGTSVSLSGDSLVVGSSGEDSLATTITNGSTSSPNAYFKSGAAFVFKRTGTNWAQEAHIKASNSDYQIQFGKSVALSGSTLAVGANAEGAHQTVISNGTITNLHNEAEGSGAAYIFQRSGSYWAPEAYIKASNNSTGSYFGESASISGDSLVIGTPYEKSSQNTITNGTTSSTLFDLVERGAAYVYRNTLRRFDPDLSIIDRAQTSITLSWPSNLGTTTQVKIAPAVVGTGLTSACSHVSAIALAAGTTSYVYSGLTAGTEYGFRVCSFDGTNESEGSTVYEYTLP